MRILVLAEGDPDSTLAGSGSVRSLVTALRAAGQDIAKGDAELYGGERLVGALASFSRRRRRWGVRFHTGPLPFALRSRRAGGAIARHAHDLDAILQYGSTFAPRGRGSVPYFLYMDSCMSMATSSSHSWAGALTASQVRSVIAREQRVFDGAAGIFTFSEAVRRFFVNVLRIPEERVLTTYAGPNLDLTRVPDRSRLARNPETPTILFVGIEFERKGGDVLLRAFANVRHRIPGARLIVIGPRDLHLAEPGVTNLGFLRKDDPVAWEQLIGAYRSADVFCFPTRFEPFGIVVLEAMLFGLPCVAAAIGAIPEMVVDGETGFLVPPDDADALAARLITLLASPDLAQRFGARAQIRSEQHFTWPAVAAKMLAFMERRA